MVGFFVCWGVLVFIELRFLRVMIFWVGLRMKNGVNIFWMWMMIIMWYDGLWFKSGRFGFSMKMNVRLRWCLKMVLSFYISVFVGWEVIGGVIGLVLCMKDMCLCMIIFFFYFFIF